MNVRTPRTRRCMMGERTAADTNKLKQACLEAWENDEYLEQAVLRSLT
jgi:hypothetical protein